MIAEVSVKAIGCVALIVVLIRLLVGSQVIWPFVALIAFSLFPVAIVYDLWRGPR